MYKLHFCIPKAALDSMKNVRSMRWRCKRSCNWPLSDCCYLIRPLARRLPYSLTLIMADASGKNKQAEATVSKRPIPNFAVEEFKKIVAGVSECQYPVLWTEEH